MDAVERNYRRSTSSLLKLEAAGIRENVDGKCDNDNIEGTALDSDNETLETKKYDDGYTSSETSIPLLRNGISSWPADPGRTCSRRRGRPQPWTVVCCVLVIAGTLFLAVELSRLAGHAHCPATSMANKPSRRPCGLNAADARRRNCVFDLANFSWLPRECVDEDLSREYLASEPEWEFFLDRNKTTKVSVDEVSKGEWEYFITGRVHVSHCSFSWLHFQKALADGRPIHSQHNMEHVQHCTKVLTKQRNDIDEVEIRVKVAFPDCGYLSSEYP